MLLAASSQHPQSLQQTRQLPSAVPRHQIVAWKTAVMDGHKHSLCQSGGE